MSELEQKQEYLQTEIFDKGYNLEEFIQYMNNIRENGGNDIDVWTMDELISAVSNYQANQLLQQQTQKLQIHQNEQVTIQFSKQVDCQQLKQSIVGQTLDLSIQIERFEKVETSFFSLSSSYVNYQVVTQPLGWQVLRRYSDFEWLRDILGKLYPGVFIPPIPNKTSTRQYTDQHLTKRQNLLERFLQAIARSKILSNDNNFQQFLSLADDKEFKQLQKNFEKIPKTTALNKILSPNGTIELVINSEIDEYYQQFHTLSTSVNSSYTKIWKQSKILSSDFQKTSETVFNLSETFGELYTAVNLFNSKVKIGQNKDLEVLLITLNNMMSNWGKSLKSQISLIQDHFQALMKYHNSEIIHIRDFINLREQSSHDYTKFKQRLDLKKEKLIQSQEFHRWEINKELLEELKGQLDNKKLCMSLILPKETASQNDLRDFYAYYNNAVHNELQHIVKSNVSVFVMNFINFTQKQAKSVNEMHIQWAEIQGNLEYLATQLKQVQGGQILQ